MLAVSKGQKWRLKYVIFSSRRPVMTPDDSDLEAEKQAEGSEWATPVKFRST